MKRTTALLSAVALATVGLMAGPALADSPQTNLVDNRAEAPLHATVDHPNLLLRAVQQPQHVLPGGLGVGQHQIRPAH